MRLSTTKLCLYTAVLVVSGFLLFRSGSGPDPAVAGTMHNVYGWAWNDNITWVSFNSVNCDTDGDGSYEGGGEDDIPAPAECPASGAVYDYGVDVGTNGDFSGYAWTQDGHLSFDPPGTAPYGETPGVSLDPVTHEVTGWARFCDLAGDTSTCSGGTAGWLAMSTSTGAYGVTLGFDNTLHGYAWSEEYGWFSFNCREGGAGRTDICASANYRAGIVTNVTGYAWSPNTGWISMNCDENLNPGAGGCANFYGVNVDQATGIVGGYAWSDNYGWVSFNEDPSAAGLDTSYSTGCTGCVPADGCSACLSGDNFYGWAQALSLGSDGWIRLDDDNTGDSYDYGLTLVAPEVHGYAWGGSPGDSGIGWISFNCAEGDYNGGNNCGSSDYKVELNYYYFINSQPDAINLEVSQDPASYGALGAYLRWTFSDDDGHNESAYRIIIDDDAVRDDDAVILDTTKCTAAAAGTDCKIDPGVGSYPVHEISLPPPNNPLAYDSQYWWWVQVWDTLDEASEWRRLNDTHNPDLDEDGNNYTFTTYSHEFPDVDILDPVPLNPSAGEETRFSNESYYYTDANPNTNRQTCNIIPSPCTYLWAVPADTTINDTSTSSPIIVFNTDTPNQEVTLTVTDPVGYQTVDAYTINPKVRLPTWIEAQ